MLNSQPARRRKKSLILYRTAPAVIVDLSWTQLQHALTALAPPNLHNPERRRVSVSERDGVEGPRASFLCQADLGSFHQNLSLTSFGYSELDGYFVPIGRRDSELIQIAEGQRFFLTARVVSQRRERPDTADEPQVF